MNLAAINSERLKLQSTRAPIWLTLVVLGLSLGFSAIQAAVLPYGLLPPERAALGVARFGVPVLMILSALTVTAEYRTGMIRTSFLATPRRSTVMIAKAVVTAIFSGIVTAVMTLGSIALGNSMMAGPTADGLGLTSPAVWQTVGALAMFGVLGAVLAVGLGALLRHTAAVVAVLVLLPFVIEPLLGTIPQVSGRVGPLLPFANVYTFTKTPWFQTFPMWWGPTGAALYFAGVVVVVFVAAVAVVGRRDP